MTGTESITRYDQQMTTHPSLIFLDMMKKLGDKLPATPKDVSVMQRKLIRAGMRGQLQYAQQLRMLAVADIQHGDCIALAPLDGDEQPRPVG